MSDNGMKWYTIHVYSSMEKSVKKALDYKEVGGSVILGISKPVIKAHGSSDARAIRSAVRQAIQAVESGYCEDIRENIETMSLPRGN